MLLSFILYFFASSSVTFALCVSVSSTVLTLSSFEPATSEITISLELLFFAKIDSTSFLRLASIFVSFPNGISYVVPPRKSSP